MKYTLLILIPLISACGTAPSATTTPVKNVGCTQTDVLGRWEKLPGPTDVLTLNSDCSGRISRCGTDFTFTAPTAHVGYTTLVLQGNNGSINCLPSGQYNCGINYTATNLAIDCGLGPSYYTRGTP